MSEDMNLKMTFAWITGNGKTFPRENLLMEGMFFMQITFWKQIEKLRHGREAPCKVTPQFLSKIEVENLIMGM